MCLQDVKAKPYLKYGALVPMRILVVLKVRWMMVFKALHLGDTKKLRFRNNNLTTIMKIRGLDEYKIFRKKRKSGLTFEISFV